MGDRDGSVHAAGHTRRLRCDPLDGNLYLFVNRRRKLMKILWFDGGSGWCIYSKRLERGTFQLPAVDDDTRRVAVDRAQLAMILEGIDLRAPRRRRYRHPGSA